MATRGSYVHNSSVTFQGHPEDVSFMQFSQNIDVFTQNDSQGFLELVQLYLHNPLEKILIFTIYPNYTLTLKGKFSSGREGALASKFNCDFK